MKFQPVYEYQDGRGHSVRYSHQRDKRRRARKRAEKLMSKTYFTNPNSSIESLYGYQHDDRRPGGVDL
jgi:hypothetical protein